VTSVRRSHTTLSFSRAVPELLAERGWTQRDLARAVDVDPAHICRLLRHAATDVSSTLLIRVADAFGVPPDFFIEHRREQVIEAVRSSSELCERLYHALEGAAVNAAPVSDLSFAAAALLSSGDRSEPRPPASSRFSREEIIAAILRWNDRYGEPPKSIDWDPSRARRKGRPLRAQRFDDGEWPTLAIVRRQFGTMSSAIEAAGLRTRPRPVRPRGQILSREDILQAIRAWHRVYGEPPALADWAPARARRLGHEWRAQRYLAGDWPHLTTVLRRFGTFGAAVEAAGLEPRPRGRHARSGDRLHGDTRAHVKAQLAAAEGPCGPGVLSSRVRAVSQARASRDPTALRGALIDLAAAALSWADAAGSVAPVLLARRSAA
jgi:transcriptional regulator with XRE-family HTH domain